LLFFRECDKIALFGGIGSAGHKKILMVWTLRIEVTGGRRDENRQKVCLTSLP